MGSPPDRIRGRAAPQTGRPLRAAALGAVLTTVTTTGTLALGAQAALTWPGAGLVDPGTALLSLTLSAATALLGWVSLVLALAALGLLRSVARPVPGTAAARPWAVRWAAATLLALTAAPATALAGPPEPTWSGVAEQAPVPQAVDTPDDVTTPGAPGAAPASDAEDHHGPDLLLVAHGDPVPLPGWTPVPPATPRKTSSLVRLVSTAPRETPSDHVVVRRGDTLWDIAARHLGPGSTVQDVAEEWPRWYAANRDLIGPDPDLILPGQELVRPRAGDQR